MTNLNHSRELYQYTRKALGVKLTATEALSRSNTLTNAMLGAFETVPRLHHKSVKFTLPDGGRLQGFEVGETAIEGELRLPFKCICLEYTSLTDRRTADEPFMHIDGVPQYVTVPVSYAPKRLVYAEDTGATIRITVAYEGFSESVKRNVWTVLPAMDVTKQTQEYIYPEVKVCPFSDYADELNAVLFFIKALVCSNVKIDKVAPTVNGKANNKRNGFIPYDSYHVLTIDVTSDVVQLSGSEKHGTHASPREHLRRGHIRRLASGKAVWVNDTVVNKGAPNVVVKDYALA